MAGICLTLGKRREIERLYNDDMRPSEIAAAVGVTSPEALATFLSSLPVLSGPWDEAFHRRYCDACSAEECGECENKALNNPLWWLSLAAEVDK